MNFGEEQLKLTPGEQLVLDKTHMHLEREHVNTQNAHLVSADGGNGVIEFDGAQAEYRKHVTLNLPVVYRDSDEGDLNDIKTNNIGFFECALHLEVLTQQLKEKLLSNTVYAF